ncbi:MAG: PepSY-associated TM helix domain-containing protein [Nostoc sp.]|uniref:PepSY-associated TM helix domain-containing protein n=1 Tax=Nostoc sp. TaxID=1180 RepID=UPI002FFA7056
MKAKQLRNLAFTLHRYIGLAIGLVLIVIGLTGSLLVFNGEISEFITTCKFGQVIPQAQEQLIAPEKILNIAQVAHSNWRLRRLFPPEDNHHPYTVEMTSPDENPNLYVHGWQEVLINPYTGVVMGDYPERYSYDRFLVNLHYRLFAEHIGIAIAGICGLLMVFLTITGLILWPGWRKLISGFKIKWNAHSKRVNFDIHKVVGVITAVFLVLTFFTGFCWNFAGFVNPIIYAVTFSPQKPVEHIEPVSQPIPGKQPLTLTELLDQVNTALPGGIVSEIGGFSTPKDGLYVSLTFPQQSADSWVEIYLDKYSGKVLQIDKHEGASQSLGDKILNSFDTLHFGTFGGLPTRIFYVFVGLAPFILFITGFVMWWYRKRPTTSLLTQANAQK